MRDASKCPQACALDKAAQKGAQRTGHANQTCHHLPGKIRPAHGCTQKTGGAKHFGPANDARSEGLRDSSKPMGIEGVIDMAQEVQRCLGSGGAAGPAKIGCDRHHRGKSLGPQQHG